jgi:hypothetical protein
MMRALTADPNAIKNAVELPKQRIAAAPPQETIRRNNYSPFLTIEANNLIRSWA